MLTNDELDAYEAGERDNTGLEALREWLCSDEVLYVGSMEGDALDALALRLFSLVVGPSVGELRAERARTETLRAALDESDRIFYGWSFDDVFNRVEKLRLHVRAALAASVEEPK